MRNSMKFSLLWFISFISIFISLLRGFTHARPVDANDVNNLLPATPQTVNETVEAIVQDPVVQNAVGHAVGNGSLSGLVVKKNVVIIPAKAPDQVLSHRQQILLAPQSHLKDIRKNISEGLQAENESSSLNESDRSFATYESAAEITAEDKRNEYGMEESEKTTREFSNGMQGDSGDESDLNLKDILPSIKPKVELPEGAITQKIDLPESIEKKVPVPVVAVLDTSKSTNEKIEGSLVALLPKQGINDSDAEQQVDFLENNRGKITEDVQRYIDESSLAIEPDTWKLSTSQIETENSMPSGESIPAYNSQMQNLNYIAPEELVVSPIVVVPREPKPYDESSDHLERLESMRTAEDVVFRPLFSFRQEAKRRASYYNANAYDNRRYSYDSYPRRRYRPRHSYYDYY